MDNWISIEDRQPKLIHGSSDSVLVCRDNGECEVAYLSYDADDGFWWSTQDDRKYFEFHEITHWQPLPKPLGNDRLRPLTDKEADIYNSQIERESISTGLDLSKSELSESEKELQDKIDAMTATLYSQLGISKESFVGTATDRYLQATDRYLQTTDLRGAVPAADVQPVSRWISVDDRLPDATYDCLVWYSCDTAFGKSKSWGIAHCSRCDWYTKHLDGDNIVVLYWMPLPEPPKDGETNG